MAGKNEEDYLDDLLKSMSDNGLLVPEEPEEVEPELTEEEIEELQIKEQVEQAVNKSSQKDEEVFGEFMYDPEFIEKSDELISSDSEREYFETHNVSPEGAASRALDEGSVDESVSNTVSEEELEAQLQQMLDNTDISEVMSADMSDEKSEDVGNGQLSQSEIDRLTGMQLDDIINDVTSDDGSDKEENSDFDLGQIAENSEENDNVNLMDILGNMEGVPDDISSNDESSDNTGADVTNADSSDILENNDNSDDDLDVEMSAAEILSFVDNDEEDSKKKKDKKKKEKKKKDKNKKGILTIIKNIFFEDVELEDAKAASDAANSSDEDGNDELSNKSDDELDENEKLIKEADNDKEEDIAPKKGFFAKLKYRLQQIKKKNLEEDKLEDEAELIEEEEKKKAKEEKKAAAAEKKEQAKQAKANKPKKEKKPKPAKPPKPKKPKKPKEPPKPTDILKIKPISMVFFALFVSGTVLLITMLNNDIHYNNYVKNANKYYEKAEYIKAYNELDGVELKKESDKKLFRQISVLMFVARHLEGYNNYITINKPTEALNELVKGIARHKEFKGEADELGIASQYDDLYGKLIEAFANKYKLSEENALELVDMYKKDFTNYYYKIEGYGEKIK